MMSVARIGLCKAGKILQTFSFLFSPGELQNCIPRKCVSVLNHQWFSSLTMNSSLQGVYTPIATPFDKNEKIAFDKLKENIEKWEQIPFRGYIVLGSTGEFVSLTFEERVELTTFVRKSVPSSKLVIAGTGCESTECTIELTRRLSGAGADAALVAPPSFYKSGITEDALYHHYKKVADSSGIPIILYSVPSNTGIDLSPSLIRRLAGHQNIIGLKDSGGDITKIGYVVYKTLGKGFEVLAGSAGFFYPALCVGCVGGVFALANSLGGPLCDLYSLYSKGKLEEACELQYKLIAPNIGVTKRFGIAGVKYSMDLMGFYGGPVRSPLLNLDETDAGQLKYEFQISGFM